jgi:hypothetical protein
MQKGNMTARCELWTHAFGWECGLYGTSYKPIKQLRPQDVNLRAGTMIVSARRKGTGVGLPGIVLQFQRVEVLATGL